MTSGVRHAPRRVWRRGGWQEGDRALPEEVPVAFTYDGAAHAVMMATPDDLRDFAIGFSLTEGILSSPEDIEALEVVSLPTGIDLRFWLHPGRSEALAARRRRMAGPVGCGMCGLETLSQARRVVPRVGKGITLSPDRIEVALAALSSAQALHAQTRAVHAAGFWHPRLGLVALREDIGRHNALDKLAGALATRRMVAESGMVMVTSRISVELVQKAAMMGATVLAGISAPTMLALEVAEAAGITVIGIARQDGFEVFTHPARVRDMAPA
ncbi:formate dehydrogenase accessory sulfurtransferase FdhD [Roseomonas marmotae]|uniref:Sulfur carrier protein FdhD n=1 Tax=Roseomonas marmotae TaxID=2768161 RepID=A0ABS3KGB0_9PROT|nr:formate dehydrogenase accessory sulfurtransferase FdhD [Roseomonas marmotae]MBO1076510.1 formate dehydrogenase accessory sulfurtransferase FdhD [Roseomonas marmotae]QTI81870.1 formate dehydrogenase accessory sulfurtransferase FdhD [Roseomonas marmotae]